MIGKLEKEIKTKSDIKSFNINKVYEDDHLMCVEGEINGVDIEWLYYDDIGFLYLWKYEDESFDVLLGSIESYYNMLFER